MLRLTCRAQLLGHTYWRTPAARPLAALAALPEPTAQHALLLSLSLSSRDLKSKNVLLTVLRAPELRAKVGDVGAAALHSVTLMSGALCTLWSRWVLGFEGQPAGVATGFSASVALSHVPALRLLL